MPGEQQLEGMLRTFPLFLGWQCSGRLGNFLVWTESDGRLVVVPEKVGHDRACPPQETYRDTVRAWGYAWGALTAAERANWETLARRGSIPMTGYVLFCWWAWHRDDAPIKTLERQYGTTVLPPSTLPPPPLPYPSTGV